MDRRGAGPSLLAKLGVGALTCNSALAAYRSRRDPASLAFVAAAYAALLLLLLLRSLRGLERAPPAGRGRGRAMAAVWALSTLLTAMFASRVAPLVPPAVGVAVWVMAVATAGGGFWAFFVAA